MNMQHIEQLKDFTLWAKNLTGKSAFFEVQFKAYGHTEGMEIHYYLFIQDLFSNQTKDIRELLALLPYLNQLCNEHKLTGQARLVA